MDAGVFEEIGGRKMIDEENLVQKLTFEDCLRNQQKLRKLLMELIHNDRCLNDSEIDVFNDILGRATFGLGSHKAFIVFTPEIGFCELGNVESFARWLGRQRKNQVVIKRDGRADLPPLGIGYLWERLLNLLDGVFAESLNLAASMSKEREKSQGGTGYEFDWER